MINENPIKMHNRINHKYIILGFSFSLFLVFFTTCVEPVEPEFDFRDGLITIDAIVSSSQGNSFATIKESKTTKELNFYSNDFIHEAQVMFVNTTTGDMVTLTEAEDENIYIPPADFVASVGETWELDIKLEDGRQYKSLPETMLEPVAINDIKATYNPELVYRESSKDYVPGHSVSVNFDDPPDKNYYYWSFRSFEKRPFCLLCRGVYRNGVCNEFDLDLIPFPRPKYYTYECETNCWIIRYNDNINIFDDEFVNGSTINQLAVADVLLFTKQDILVEVQQFSLSKAAYKYYKVIKDLVDNNSGFNAPPPATLIGNMFNPNNDEEYVLGRFTAGSASTASIFIERNSITESGIDPVVILIPEGSIANPNPPLAFGGPVLYAPCPEGTSRYSTTIKPEDWPN